MNSRLPSLSKRLAVSLRLQAAIILLLGALSSALAAVPSVPGPFIQGTGTDHLVVIEAENFDSNTPNGDSWVEIATPIGFVGSGGMEAQTDDGTNDAAGDGPLLAYQISFSETGNHTVHVRGDAEGDDQSNSVWVGLNGDTAGATRVNLDASAAALNGWGWADGTATINVPSAGVHTLNVWMREDGSAVDRLLVTTNGSYTPSGSGPAESAREMVDGLCITSVAPSNYQLVGGVWQFDLDVTLLYQDAPETTVTFNGTSRTLAGTTGTETFSFTGIPVAESVVASFPTTSTTLYHTDKAVVPAPAAVTCNVLADVGGTIFRDYDADGVQDTYEFGYGVAGMYVAAYDSSNAIVGTQPVSVDGSYSFGGVTGDLPLRLEFRGLPDWLEFGAIGAASSSGVAFVSALTCDVDIPVQNPTDYVGASPTIALACYVNGDPTAGGTSGTSDWFVGLPYTPTGDGTGASENDYLANGTTIGATWGVAYQRSSQKIFAAAMMKRHAGTGTGGTGAIYEIDPAAAPASSGSLFMNLSGAPYNIDTDVPGGTSRTTLPAAKVDPNTDPDAFDAVGKVGLGGMDISDDENTLWVMNLYDKTLYEIEIGSPASAPAASGVTGHGLPDPSDSTGEFRPWAVKVRDGLVYVGGVTSGETGGTASDMKGYVYVHDPGGVTGSFTEVLSFDLDYERGYVSRASASSHTDAEWRSWIDDWSDIVSPAPGAATFSQTTHPQPVLSDLEFDEQGAMVIGMFDRLGHQTGNDNYSPTNVPADVGYEGAVAGDILRACQDASGEFVLETAGGCGGVNSGDTSTPPQGPGGAEFYKGDWYQINGTNVPSDGTHQETGLGGLAAVLGEGNVAMSAFDPVDAFRAGGVEWLQHSDGDRDYDYEIFGQDAGIARPASFGKAAGLGDIAVLGASSPLIVGNRVWDDANGNGVQDAGEGGLAGVTVTLICGAMSVTTTTAADDGGTDWDESGEFYFSNAPGANAENVLVEGERCYLQVRLADTNLGTRALTLGTDATNDVHDNDAIAVGANAVIAFTAGDAGENDYDLDFGFSPPYDFGDLPEGGSYDFPTAGSAAGDRPRHTLGSGLSLGATVDAEVDGQPSLEATGDGLDEDGVVLSDLFPGASETLNVIATVPGTVTGTVYLNAWIDFNSDGDFDDSGEQIADGEVVTNGNNAITFTVPSDADSGVAYARFRISTTESLDSTGNASDGEVEDYLTTIVEPKGAIGNYVWLDEDSNGLQNAGEPGISRVVVNLYLDPDGGGFLTAPPAIVATTTTDSEGGYLFPGLAAGLYYVQVQDDDNGGLSTLPGALTQTTSYTLGGGDFGNKNDTAFDFNGTGYKIQLGADEVNKTADFGYNWNPTSDVLSPGGVEEATIGDLVWLDADQDGLKDPNEVGLAGVTLGLISAGPDGLFGTSDDVITDTDTTDEAGSYIFDGLDPDAYKVVVTDTGGVLTGYTQTADPDTIVGLSLPNDGMTTAPVLLAPGDVYINADFGYYVAGLGAVGDTVWLDADGSGGATQGSELGISGVTVSLIGDKDRDGIWDENERVLATDTTDATGKYLFPGLSLDDGSGQAGYIVWVNDTDAALQGHSQTYDDETELDDLSVAILSSGTPFVLTEDFSYTAVEAPGTIGDTIWADLDSSGGDQGTQGTEPGIAGLTVTLYTAGPDGAFGNADDVTVDSAVTNSLGQYLFTNLDLQTYQVRVTTAGLGTNYNTTPTYDADGGTDSISTVTLSASNRHDRSQDFSYPPSGTNTASSVGDTVYIDTNGDDSQDLDGADNTLGTSDDEPGVQFVLVELLDGTAASVGTTVTDENGQYLFSGLAPGDYTVRVLTPPPGYTQTQDVDTPLAPDNQSTTNLVASEHDRLQDFGYQPASGTLYAIGNTVWLDVDDSGTADDPTDGGGTEPGIPGVTVYLLTEGADNTIGTADDEVTGTRETDENGYYLFAGLTAAEDYRVVVDTKTLPLGVSPRSSYERDSGSDSETTVSNLASNVMTEDFSYPYCSAIGDTVFFDMNADDSQDAGELGFAGVTVNLLNASAVAIASATTDYNGRYFFDCLEEGTYTVTVDASTLPPGFKNTADPDAVEDGSTVIILGGGDINLTGDFGYAGDDGVGLGSIGTLVWQDENADAANDGPTGPDTVASTDDDEPVLSEVTVDLYLDTDEDCFITPDDYRIATLTTNATTATNYLFDNLSVTNGAAGGAKYVVQVSDRSGVLNGYWHSTTTGTVDNTSKANAYCVTLTSGTSDDLTADFGYYQHGACTGNFVWEDANADGDQDTGEEGIDDVEVSLVVTYPSGHSTTTKATTGDDPSTGSTTEKGFYAFCNLLLDEGFREGSATKGVAESAKPAFTLSVDPYQDALEDLSQTAVYAANSGTPTVDRTDSDDGENGTKANPTQGITEVQQVVSASTEQNEASYDFGYVSYDFGDLPEGGNKDFPTAGSTGPERARHVLGSGILLGATVDAESNGQPDVSAKGDGSDEDGFAFLPDLVPGASYTLPYTVVVPGGSPTVYLNAWIDFDCDGDLETAEQIADSDTVTDGSNTVSFTVPATAVPGRAYARFRLSTTENLGVTGDASDGEVEDYVVSILKPVGAIGNYVWFDENSDGLQDAGEVGMPDVIVNLLYDADGAGGADPVAQAQTVTDANGGYLFNCLAAGLYYVDVDESAFYDPDDAGPAGLTQTTVFTNGNGDFGNKDHTGDGYAVQLGPNAFDPTADFGYNWESTSEVDLPTAAAKGMIGDRVWIDADRDGHQDPGEVGIPNVVMELCAASDPTTVLAVEATKANGCYVFEQLDPNAYLVKIATSNFVGAGALIGLTQYGDPDHFGATGINDGRTTTPIVLAPGDVFLNADFGFDDSAAPGDAATDLGRIGDRVWYDADVSADAGQGVKASGPTEVGLAGVTVTLIGDKNRDGVWDLDGADDVLGGTGNADDELVLATDITDTSGCYFFDGLPLDDGSGQAGYIVWINDTGNVLQGLTTTFDPDGVLDSLTAVELSTSTKETISEDFSYTIAQAVGSIGNTIWADLDNSGGNESSKGPEPGIAGLTINLYTAGADGTIDTADDVFKATTTTNSKGQYLFTGLPYQVYEVEVVTAGLSSDFDTTPSYDPGGAVDSKSVVTISALAPHDRQQDFSYPSSGTLATASIGDTVYFDLNGGGIQDVDGLDNILGTSDDEPGIQGVIVELIQSSTVIAVTRTDEDGKYLFSGLAPGTYTVKVATPPPGYTQTQDPDGGADNESEEVLSAGEADRLQDFGYEPPAGTYYAIGNTIWLDQDASGTADDPTDGGGTEPGLEGVRVTLTTKGDDNTFGTDDDETEGIQTTDGNGYYLFAGLEGGIDYQVSVDTPTLPDGVSPISTYENDGANDSVTTVTALASNVMTEDFSYPSCGGIGDTVYFDGDFDGTQDVGDAGLSGVLVSLKSGGVTVATTTTDTNGRYYFDCLSAGTYVVEVTSGLPPGLEVTGDPDASKDGTTTLILGAGVIHLTSDFGYSGDDAGPLGSIGSLVWRDENADGDDDSTAGAGTDDDEVSIAGATVELFYDVDGDCLLEPGEPKLGTAITTGTATDNYLFSSLPIDDGGSDMSYIVKVSDVDDVLLGFWHSLDPSHDGDNSSANDSDSTSKPDPYCVTLSTTRAEEINADFGYYLDPACVGNFVWIDTNGDGQQDAGELGVDGVAVNLSISYPNGATINLSTVTADNPDTIGTAEVGYYDFCNLLLDEDYRVADAAPSGTNPFLLITVDATQPALDGYGPTLIDNVASDFDDSDNPYGTVARPVQGLTDTTTNADPTIEGVIASYDFGFATDADDDDLADVGDFDPQGFFYAEGTGEIIPGGSISIIPPTGGSATLIEDGSSGEYRWVGSDVEGVYTMVITEPPGWDICRVPATGNGTGGAFDPTLGSTDNPTSMNPVDLGADVDPTNPGYLDSATVTPYYVTFDLQKDDPLVISNNIPLKKEPETTFAAWANNFGLTGDDALPLPTGPLPNAGNPDDDIYDNVLEYALCGHPSRGVTNHNGFCVEVGTGDTLEAVIRRPNSGLSDVTYILQGRSALPTTGDTTWTDLISFAPGVTTGATVTDLGDGSEELRIADIAGTTVDPTDVLTNADGFVRLTASLFVSPDTFVESTMVQGWKETDYGTNECATFANPFNKKEKLSGVVDSITGTHEVNSPTSFGTLDLGDLLDLTNKSYYIEVIEGDNVGHRFDVTAASNGQLTLASDADVCVGAPHNTVQTDTALPASLAGDHFILREHYTIAETFPPTAPFVAGADSSVADRILVFTSTGFDIYYLDSEQDPDVWLLDGSDLIDDGGTVLPPNQGLFIHPRSNPVTMLTIGVVRENQFCMPLNSGYTLMAGGFPVDQSIADRALTGIAQGGLDSAFADQVHFWSGDEGTYVEGYECYFRLSGAPVASGITDRWVDIVDANLGSQDATAGIFKFDRSAFYLRRQAGCEATYCQPLPWLP